MDTKTAGLMIFHDRFINNCRFYYSIGGMLIFPLYFLRSPEVATSPLYLGCVLTDNETSCSRSDTKESVCININNSKKIEFGVFSPQDVKHFSVLELHQRDLYDISMPNRAPAKFGVLDKRLGTSEKTDNCETCGESIQDCVGHFGVIRLALPVFHIGYFKLLITILQNICKVNYFKLL
jgi:hypothetical protein